MLLLFIAVAGRSQAQDLPAHSDFAIGMSQEYILSRFGQPLRISTFHKQNESIRGPIESYWATLPLGSAVVLWSLQVPVKAARAGQNSTF